MVKNGWGAAAKRWEPPSAVNASLPVAPEQQEMSADGSTVFHCSICNMWLNGRDQFQDHLIGRRHRRKRRALAMRWAFEIWAGIRLPPRSLTPDVSEDDQWVFVPLRDDDAGGSSSVDVSTDGHWVIVPLCDSDAGGLNSVDH